MIFEVDPAQISRLDSLALVHLMKRLLLAECKLIDVRLRGTTVPVQITVPDGGEDGRVEWQGGAEETDYLPSRFCIFQSKAQNLTPALIEAEIFTKDSTRQFKGGSGKLELNAAVSEALARGGSYVIFCSEPFTGQKKKHLRKAIEDAIKTAGETASRLASIVIYDANTIADWVNTHRATALWLNSQERRRSLSGFQSHDGWGRSPEIHKVPWANDDRPRFAPANYVIAELDRQDRQRNVWTFSQAAEAILRQLADKNGIVRIAGPSGFGKSRFVYEVFNRSGLPDQIDAATMIYADVSIVDQELTKLALEIADAGAPTILVVDDCPDSLHTSLATIAQRLGSRLSIVTINVETRLQQAKDTLVISLEPAHDKLIGSIATGIAPALTDADTRFIQDLSSGFPRMAVLAAQEGGRRRQAIVSIEQVIERILWGKGASNDIAQKTIEIVSIFDWVGISGRVKEQGAYISRELIGISEDNFVEHVKAFEARGIIAQRGDFIQVQPIPLAARLASRRLSLLPDGKLTSFFLEAPSRLQKSLLHRLRWLDTSHVAQAFAKSLLRNDCLGNFAAVNTDFGSECLYHLVHVDPDGVMATIETCLAGFSLEQLRNFKGGRRYVVWALEKLAFRKKTFERAATLLRRLGAAEIEEHIANNAGGQFKELYQLHLSGTEAGPEERLHIIDEGLRSAEPEERALCVDALGRMLQIGHFTRTSGAEEIGSGECLEDWTPATYGEIWDFHRSAMNRLANIAVGDDDFAKRARDLLGSNMRDLLNAVPFDDVRAMVLRVVKHRGTWIEAIHGVNSWLYFDRRDSSKEVGIEVRNLFDELLPKDPVDLVMLYAQGWQTDLHDPDVKYNSKEPASNDFEYPIRELHKLAEAISHDENAVNKVLDRFVASSAKTIWPFACRLAELADDPSLVFAKALQLVQLKSEPANPRFFGGLIAGTDKQDPQAARDCLRMALSASKLKQDAISMISSGKLRPDDLCLAVSLLRSRDIQPWQCTSLSYGRGLDHLAPAEIIPLLDELKEHGVQGCYAAIEIAMMYDYGGSQMSDVLADKLKAILLTPKLFEDSPVQEMSAYHLEHAAKRLIEHGKTDRKFAKLLLTQLSSIYKRRRREVSTALRGPVREITIELLALYPREVWRELSKAFLSNDWLTRFNVEHLFEPSLSKHTDPGPLYSLPSDVYLAWVRKAPATRARIIIKWLPITALREDQIVWHADLAAYVDEFGDQPEVLSGLAERLHPRTTWGSLAPYLEPFLPLLSSWEQSHRRLEVRRWAAQVIESFRAQIAVARKRDDERGAGIY